MPYALLNTLLDKGTMILTLAENIIEFEVEISEEARDIFYKEYYPSMRIESDNNTVIRGFYHPGEEAFIADYFMKFGH